MTSKIHDVVCDERTNPKILYETDRRKKRSSVIDTSVNTGLGLRQSGKNDAKNSAFTARSGDLKRGSGGREDAEKSEDAEDADE